jgi:hypothetical protein
MERNIEATSASDCSKGLFLIDCFWCEADIRPNGDVG